jgi:hypothetical protein
MGRTGMLCLVLSLLLGSVAGASAEDLTLPRGLQWCQPLPEVADLLGITDTSEEGLAYRSDGEYLVTGELWGHAGNWTVRFLEFGDQYYLIEAEFRMFRDLTDWDALVEKLSKQLGAGQSEVVATPVTGADGEVVQNGRTKYIWKEGDGAWTVTARQMSNEIDGVKYAHGTPDVCKPEVVEDEELDLSGADKIPTGESRESTVFEYDPYADDPLHADEGAKKKEEEEKRKEEQKKEEEEKSDVVWDDKDKVDW